MLLNDDNYKKARSDGAIFAENRIWKTKFCLVAIFLSEAKITVAANNSSFTEERSCGSLHNGNHTFILNDFDQSANMRKDYRVSTSGWWNTTSIKIEPNCTMNVCTKVYFQGDCQTLSSGNHSEKNITSSIRSSNCTCEMVTRCETLNTLKSSYSCGRAYPVNACHTANSVYFPLRFGAKSNILPIKYADSIEKIVLRLGCNLTVWPEEHQKGENRVIYGSTTEITGRIRSYECACDNRSLALQEKPHVDPQLVDLPSTKDELLSLVSLNSTIANHSGWQAALKSMRSGRSVQNAYVLIIGASNPEKIGLEGCRDISDKIGECHITVDLDSLGISNAEVRVIWANVAPFRGPDGEAKDFRWAATLAEYLSNHTDLRDAIPNAVVVFHHPLNDATHLVEGSRFQRKMRLINMLRPLILDEKYSNLVFVLEGLLHLSTSEQRNPDKIINNFENAILYGKWGLPDPLFIVTTSYWSSVRPTVNGFYKIENGEYQFRNLQQILKLIALKTGDDLGHSMFNVAFPVEKQIARNTQKGVDLFPDNHDQVEMFTNLATCLPPLSIQKGLDKKHRQVLKCMNKSNVGEPEIKNYMLDISLVDKDVKENIFETCNCKILEARLEQMQINLNNLANEWRKELAEERVAYEIRLQQILDGNLAK